MGQGEGEGQSRSGARAVDDSSVSSKCPSGLPCLFEENWTRGGLGADKLVRAVNLGKPRFVLRSTSSQLAESW